MYGDWKLTAQIIICEIFASMVFVFFFLTQTEEKTQLSKDRAICCFIVAASYVGARSLCGGSKIIQSGAVLNPAIGIVKAETTGPLHCNPKLVILSGGVQMVASQSGTLDQSTAAASNVRSQTKCDCLPHTIEHHSHELKVPHITHVPGVDSRP